MVAQENNFFNPVQIKAIYHFPYKVSKYVYFFKYSPEGFEENGIIVHIRFIIGTSRKITIWTFYMKNRRDIKEKKNSMFQKERIEKRKNLKLQHIHKDWLYD